MQSFDELALRDATAIDRVTSEQLRSVRDLVGHDLRHGRDAWPAVSWLAATRDAEAKEGLIRELTAVIDGASSALLDVEAAADNFGSEIVFGRAARERRRISRAFDFVTALQRSLHHESEADPLDLGFEQVVDRRRSVNERQSAREEQLSRFGVQPASGLPFWELYMRRRRHKSWG